MLRKSLGWFVTLAVVSCGTMSAGTFGKVVPIGGEASDLALDESRGVLYIANLTANRIDVMSLADNSIQTSMNVAAQPSSIALTWDRHYLLVTHFGNWAAPASQANALTVIDLTTKGKQTLALGNPPLGVACGLDNKCLVVTTQEFILFDPALGTTKVLDTISDVAAQTLPVDAPSFPPEITNASLGVSGDGTIIFGVGGSTGTFTFRYDVNQQRVEPGGVVLSESSQLGPRVVSVNQDGSDAMVGWLMVDSHGTFVNFFPQHSNQLNVGSSVFDSSRGVIYAQMPVTAGEAPVLKIVDADNLTVRETLQLPENLGGKSAITSDFSTVYSISDSGVTVLPVGSVASQPRVAATAESISFAGNFCDRRVTSKGLSISNPGGGKTSFTISSDTPGVTVSPSSGVTPATVQVQVDPTYFQNQKGTSVATLTIQSSQALNVPPTVRVLVNNREPDQRGTFVDVPGTLVDLLADPTRDRIFILRQDKNEVLVFDGDNYTQTATLRTGNQPTSMAFTFDQRYLLVGNAGSQIVNVYDLETLAPQQPILMPSGHVANSLAASAKAILAATTYFDGTSHIVKLDFNTRTGAMPSSLGIFNNVVNNNTVLAASPNGSTVLAAEADGTLLLYDANSDSFTVARKDYTALGGAYGASNFNQYVVGNHLLNASLVPVATFETGTGSSSGFVFVDSGGIRTTAPDVNSPGVIQRVDTTTGAAIAPTRIAEAPLLGSQGAAFTRTLAFLYSRNAIFNLTVSGFTVLPWTYDASVAPPHIDKIVNAADLSPGLAPGGLISIFGTNLSPVNLATKEIPVPTALGDSCLTVNGQPMPILFVSPTQVNAQMPFQALGNVTVILWTPGGVSDNFNLTVLPAAPSVFRSGQAGPETNLPTVVRDSNGMLVTASNPLHRDDTAAIYLTGMGQVYPSVDAGLPGPMSPFATAIIPPVVTLGGVQLPLSYAGLAPGEVGVYQINIKVLRDVPLGLSVPLTITQGDQSTTILVRVVN